MRLTDRQWKSLFRDIENHRCILLLGPRFWAKAENGHGRPLLELLAEHLSGELEAEGIAFEKQAVANLPYIAQRFLSIPKIRRIDLEDEATSFFERHNQDIPATYRLLAQMPFHLIVNTAPDQLIYQAILAEGRPGANFYYYNYKKDRGLNVPVAAVQAPLVFNLFGALDDPESLVLTEENQVEFIKNVVKGNPPIPYQIMGNFDNRKTYLFLGFDLEHWHYRLLLDSLKLEDENTTIFPQMDDYPLTELTKSFYEDRYHFFFVDKKISDFVQDLHRGFFDTVSAEEVADAVRTKKIVILSDDNPSDVACVQKLANHLANLEHNRQAVVWHRGLLPAGESNDTVIREIEHADIVVAVLSADFFASERISQVELPAVMAAYFEKNIPVVPVMHRDCDIENSPLRRFASVPPDGRAISRWDDADAAFARVVDYLKPILNG